MNLISSIVNKTSSVFFVLVTMSLSSLAQVVSIPDANFKAYLIGNSAINVNGDTEIQTSEANTFSGAILCQGLSISDLTGIQSFTSLTELRCQSNALTSLNVSSNLALERLYCGGNQLTTLDISQNTALMLIYCQVNQLTYLNVANGNNINMGSGFFAAHTNPGLTCITVDDVAYSTTNWSTNIDAQTSFSTNCPCVVSIPDANFKAFLVGNPAINTNGDSEIQCAEATAYNGIIQCDNQSISSLVGVEAFTNLTGLVFPFNQVSSVDLSQNTALTQLSCGSNLLTSIDVSQNTNLTFLACWINQLSSLDVSQNTALTQLHCNNNQLASLDVSTNTLLTNLLCGRNQLLAIDVTMNTELNTFDCSRNQLSMIDVSLNTDLVTLKCDSNQLTSLDVSQNDILQNLDVNNNLLSTLNVSQNTSLFDFSCSSNQLTALDVSQNQNLTFLYCSNNQITALDVSQNTSMFSFNCSDNQLVSLDVSQVSSLYEFACSGNSLVQLDLSQNTNLHNVSCDTNQLECLNIKNGTNTGIFGFWASGNPNLSCIEVDDAAYSQSNWTNVDAQTSFNTDCGSSCTIGLSELTTSPKELIKIVDLMGRETVSKPNTPLIYIYSDGTAERVFDIEE